MTSPNILVTPAALRELTGKFRGLATGLTPGHLTSGASWQATATATVEVTVGIRRTAVVLAGRLTGDAEKFAAAADEYAATDAHGAAEMAGLRLGADGGAGALGVR